MLLARLCNFNDDSPMTIIYVGADELIGIIAENVAELLIKHVHVRFDLFPFGQEIVYVI